MENLKQIITDLQAKITENHWKIEKARQLIDFLQSDCDHKYDHSQDTPHFTLEACRFCNHTRKV